MYDPEDPPDFGLFNQFASSVYTSDVVGQRLQSIFEEMHSAICAANLESCAILDVFRDYNQQASVSFYEWSMLFKYVAQPLGYTFVIPEFSTCSFQGALQETVDDLPGRTLHASGGAGQCRLLSMFYCLARIILPQKTPKEIVKYLSEWMLVPNNALHFAQAFMAQILIALPDADYKHIARLVTTIRMF
jgi:hypothetical protein